MKIIFHQGLSSDQWFKKNIFEQMANIGSEVYRALKWQKKNTNYSKLAFERSLELLDLTIEDKNNKDRFKELHQLREILVDYFVYNNSYHSTPEFFEKYFYSFNYAARI